MILICDIGNTNATLGLYQGEVLVSMWRLSTDHRKTVHDYAISLAGLFQLEALDTHDVSQAIIGSVVPAITEVMEQAISVACGCPVFVVSATGPMSVVNRYAAPSEVGIDRLANAVGAVALVGAPVVVVDLGTAVTLDVVSNKKEYLGGAILPGPEMSAEALARRTARLPLTATYEAPTAIGRTTGDSIRSGILNGLVGAVDHLVDQIWKELGYKTAMVATGGLAYLVTSSSRRVKRHCDDLTLQGLRLMWMSQSEATRKTRKSSR